MSWVYTQADYFGVVDDDYLKYESARRQVRGTLFNASWNSLKNAKILIAGCGFGGLVEELMGNWGFADVWGFDASAYAVGRGDYPAREGRILQGDVLSSQSMNSVRQAAGLRGQQRFSLVITEDLLPCMANAAEVQTCLTNLRGISQSVAHIISLWDASEQSYTYRAPDGSIRYLNGDLVMRMPGFLWWTEQEWLDAIGTNSEWVFTPSGERVQ